MEQFIFQDCKPEDRLQYLKDNAHRVEEQDYLRDLSEEERSQKQEKLSKLQAEILKETEEKKETVKQYNDALKDKNEHNAELVKQLKLNAEEVCEPVYLIPDEESRMMGIYNKAGKLIRSRPLSQDEMQKSIFNLKTVSNE